MTVSALPPLRPLFPTLRAAGYAACAHPRRRQSGVCADCGASPPPGTPGSTNLSGGSLDYRRADLM